MRANFRFFAVSGGKAYPFGYYIHKRWCVHMAITTPGIGGVVAKGIALPVE